MTQEDELRLLQERFDVHGFVSEFNITGALWTSRVTSHVPLREVADAITGDGVCTPCEIVHRYLVARRHRGAAHRRDGAQPARRRRRLDRPRGDRHHRARDRALRSEGIDAGGPCSSDTVFLAAAAATSTPS